MRGLVALALTLLLAGCSGDPAAETNPAVEAPLADSAAATRVVVRTVEKIPVLFDGSLGTRVHGCVFPADVCQTQDVQPETAELLIERPGANLTALDLV